MAKRLLLIGGLIIVLLAGGCASGYRAVRPDLLHYTTASYGESVDFGYK